MHQNQDNIQLYPMLNPFLPNHPTTHTASRDPLLQLLTNTPSHSTPHNYQNDRNKIKKQKSNGREALDSYPSKALKPPPLLKQSHNPEIQILSSQEMKGSKSERALDRMAFHLRKEGEESSLAGQLKLPLINRSASQNSNIITRNKLTPKLQKMQSEGVNNKKQSPGSFYSKKSDKLTRRMELDQYILRHLEFLDKFEQQLVGNRLSQGLKLPQE